QPSPSPESAPLVATPPPAELGAKGENFNLEQKVGSTDIDSLLHLSSSESSAVARADQPPSMVLAPPSEINFDLESNELDSILGAPEEPQTMGLPEATTTGGEASLSADAAPSAEDQPRPKRLTRLTTAPSDAVAVEQPAGAGPQEALPEWVENLKPTE